MQTLLGAIVEPKVNSKAFLQTIHALQTSAQRVSRSTRDTPRNTQFSFFAKRITIQNNGSFFLFGCCLCVSLPSTTEGGFLQYRARLRSTLRLQALLGEHKARTTCNETWQHVPQNNKNMRVLKRGTKRVNICVSVRKKRHPLRVRVMQT
jgi:hypothetical protein